MDKLNFALLFDESPNPYLVMSPTFVILGANRAYLQVTNRSLAQIANRLIFDAFPSAAERMSLLRDSLQRCVARRERDPISLIHYPITRETPDGPVSEDRFWSATHTPLLDAQGVVRYILQHTEDITELHRLRSLESQLGGAGLAGTELENRLFQRTQVVQSRSEDLHRLVEARTQELRDSEEERLAMQETLFQAQKMDAIGKLTGGVAHDFNNTLQVIGTNLQLLQKNLNGDEKAQRRLDAALAGVARGAKLASHLLAFARKQPLSPVVLDAGKLLRGLDDMLRRSLGEGVEVESVVAGGLWNTLVDPSFLENALLNLAINARDAMDGQGKLTIEAGNASLDDRYAATHAEVTPGQYVMIAISDTGSGMADDVLQRAFDPFFTTKGEGKGTGLGLSMVHGFVKQTGGHVKIYSELGHGTTIKLYLPRSHELELGEAVEAPTAVLGGSETILVVEDDAQVREVVVEMLSELGYRVLKSSDAQSALAVVQSGVAIDLLFTDVVMPGILRSPELARLARAIQPHIEVLFTSGYTENSIVHGGRLDPGVALLSKPYRREDLARKVRHMLSNRQHAVGLRGEVDRLSEDSVATDSASRELPSLRVLVVEDDEESLASTVEILEHLGHRAHGVTSAEEALQTLASAHFDVLMTDVSLPGLSGIELAHQAIALQSLQVVIASGYAELEGAPAHSLLLAKPFGIEQIETVLLAAVRALHASTTNAPARGVESS